MKFTQIIALIGVTSAIKLGFASGANGDEDLGQDIIMKGDKYHYNQANMQKLAQFATGMNGDEDLGQDIIMKGDKYHYNQNLVQFASGMNGDEDLGQDIIMKGDKYHYNQNMAQFATGMNGDEDLGEDIIMKGKPFHYNQKALAQVTDAPVQDEAEKVSVLQTPIAGGHTSFYAQKN